MGVLDYSSVRWYTLLNEGNPVPSDCTMIFINEIFFSYQNKKTNETTVIWNGNFFHFDLIPIGFGLENQSQIARYGVSFHNFHNKIEFKFINLDFNCNICFIYIWQLLLNILKIIYPYIYEIPTIYVSYQINFRL